MASTAWRVELVVPAAAAEPVAMALDPLGEALAVFELSPGGDWRIVLHSEEEPDAGQIAAVLTLAGLAAGVELPEPEIGREAEVDWMARLADSFPAIRVGRFHLHGSHLPPGPPGKISLLVDAATAFGSGEHQTTRGCLQALDRLGARRRRRRPLDVGTGTGVLAFAAAKLWRIPVAATDLDAESVRVARANARRNGVGKLVRVDAADGLAPTGWVGRRGHDLVFANILANPLTRMARAIRRAMAPGGVAILSGLLAHQERQVLAAYRRQGLRLERRIAIEGWHTLVLRR